MKKGEFCKYFNVPLSTVRFYIECGLLVPKKCGHQFIFSEEDIRDMNIINKLHDLAFSNSEIKNYLKVVRLYAANDPSIDEKELSLFHEKRHQLEASIRTMSKQLASLEASIQERGSAHQEEPVANSLGVPLDFLPFLACPNCTSSLNLVDAKISNMKISHGAFLCDCGYRIAIDDGILLVEDPLSNYYESDEFDMDHYGVVASKDPDFVFFEHMDRINPEVVTLLNKAYSWGNTKLQEAPLCKPVIFLPDLSSHYFYMTMHEEYYKDALIVISGFSKKHITSIKKHIEIFNKHNLKILFVANTIHTLPLKPKIFDLCIDMGASYNFSYYHNYSMFTRVRPYLSNSCQTIGLSKYYDKNSQTLKEIKKLYKNSYCNYSLLSTFKHELCKNQLALVELTEIGTIKNPGDYYRHHIPGETQTFFTYIAEANTSEKI